jgi:hypothetical protein
MGERSDSQARGGTPPRNGERSFRVVTAEYPDRVEVRVEEQEWLENFGWVTRGDPSTFPRFKRVIRRRPGWLPRLLACVRLGRDPAETQFHVEYRRQLERVLVAAQVEANRRNQERQLITHHLDSVREVFDPREQ